MVVVILSIGKNKQYTSINDMIIKIYSTEDNKLLPWKFNILEDNYFYNDINKKLYLDWLFNKLGYKNKEDWYNLSINDLKHNNGRTLYLNDSYINIISKIYDLDINKFIKWTSERLLCERVNKHFSNNTFKKDKPDWLKYITGRNLELDYYCEELKLAFEYNGIQHYEYTPHFHNNNIQEFHEQQERDKFKKQRCEEEDVYLIIIPYQYNCYNEEELYEYIDEKIRKWENKMNQ